MDHYAGIDVSLELSSVCVVDAKGKIIKEAKISSEPGALVIFLRGLGMVVERIGLEAGPLSQWLHAGIDVSLELSSVCVVDAKGKIIKEAKISSEPGALVIFLRGLGMVVERIGLEAGPLSQWLHA